MRTFARLKFSIGDSSPHFLTIDGYDFSELLDLNPEIELDAVLAAVMLEQFFIKKGYNDWQSNMTDLHVYIEGDINFYGEYENLLSDGLKKKTSGVCFTEESLKTFLYDSISSVEPVLSESLLDGSIEEYNNALEALGWILRAKPSEDIDLRFYRSSDEELSMSGLESSGKFTDVFPILKKSLSNTSPTLETSGYTKAEYISSGDYLSMRSAYVLYLQELSNAVDYMSFNSFYGAKNSGGSDEEVTAYLFSFQINGGEIITRWFYSSLATVNEPLGVTAARLIPEVFGVSGSTNEKFFMEATIEDETSPPSWEGDRNTNTVFSSIDSSYSAPQYRMVDEVNTFNFVDVDNEKFTELYEEISSVVDEVTNLFWTMVDLTHYFAFSNDVVFESKHVMIKD